MYVLNVDINLQEMKLISIYKELFACYVYSVIIFFLCSTYLRPNLKLWMILSQFVF